MHVCIYVYMYVCTMCICMYVCTVGIHRVILVPTPVLGAVHLKHSPFSTEIVATIG